MNWLTLLATTLATLLVLLIGTSGLTATGVLFAVDGLGYDSTFTFETLLLAKKLYALF